MLLWVHRFSEMDFDRLMQVYWEGNRENALTLYPHMDTEKAHIRAQQDFEDYLKKDFFRQKGARYGIWVQDEIYLSALRLEPWEDGLLLEALETHPDYRRQGFAKRLILGMQEAVRGIPIYSHVSKRNSASLAVHKSCGFRIIKDSVRLLDGTVSANSVTLQWIAD